MFEPAHELAARIRRRAVTAVEVLDAHLQHIERHNPSLNAIVTLDDDGARRRAHEADAALARGEVWGPLHGVPFTVKDAFETAGLRTTGGFPDLTDYVPPQDAPAVTRLRAAGGILLGKTNLPVGSMLPQTDNPTFGRSNNPWDLTRTPGGSTGGGAAAVAAGLSPLDLGADGGGSLRQPAHYCGLFTLKPTEWRVPTTGYVPEKPGQPRGLRHLVTVGTLTRSVEDLELALRVLAGPDGRQWEVPPVPLGPAPDRPLASLRLAWTDDFGGVPVTDDTRAALAALADQLARQGCQVARRSPEDFDVATTWQTYAEIMTAETTAALTPEQEAERDARAAARLAQLDAERTTRRTSAPVMEDQHFRGMVDAAGATMRQYTHALTTRDGLIAALEQFFTMWDAWLCPVAFGPAFPHCPVGAPITVDDVTVSYFTLLGHVRPFNLTGHPAVVLPLTRSRQGLPIGLQVVGRRWGEMELLAIAQQVSRITGPFQRPPGY